MRTIGVYIPKWLYRSDKTDRIFWDEFIRTIAGSGRFRPLRIALPTVSLDSPRAAKAFCEKHDLALIVQHDSAFYSDSKKYAKNVELLQGQVPFINSFKSHEIGHDKVLTKRLLRDSGIPVLDDAVLSSVEELLNHLQEGTWYVVKPTNKGAGSGVKLIKKEDGVLSQYCKGSWRPVTASSKSTKAGEPYITIRQGWGIRASFSYRPMLVEPYFNDDEEGFASLRCTVVGGRVLEAVKRVNRLNITSNVSSGGTARKVELTNEQEEMAIAAVRAIGADYAGVDFLVCNGKSVIGEINIGPFTVFSSRTGSRVGEALADHAMKKADGIASRVRKD